MIKREIISLKTIDIDDDISRASEYLGTNHQETIYVIDSENVLHGVITIGDFLKKAAASKNVKELMNRNYLRIKHTPGDESANEAMATASKLFAVVPNTINEIPIVNNGKLMFVLKREANSSLARWLDLTYANIGLSIDIAANNGKKLIILGRNEFSELFCSCINNLGTACFIDDVSELAYEDTATYFILVIEPQLELSQINRAMLSYNLTEGQNYHTIISFVYHRKFQAIRDAHLVIGRMLDLPGFKVYGNVNNVNEAELCIVALGSSTTCSVSHNFASWPEHLYHLLVSKGLKPVVLNGGFQGYSTSLELIKLIRDVIPMEPDIVISYSGIIDFLFSLLEKVSSMFKRPFVHSWQGLKDEHIIYGVQNDKDIGTFWIDNMRMMNSICKEFDVKYLGVLEANAYSEGMPSAEIDATCKYGWLTYKLFEAYSRQLNIKPIYDKIESKIAKIPYIRSFRHIFDGIDDIYYDGMHVQERGNAVIAMHIYKTLKEIGHITIGQKA